MVSYNVTRGALASDGTYTNSTIKGDIQPGGGNVGGVPGAWAKYAHSFFTSATIIEGDRVTHLTVNLYDVHHCSPYREGDSFEHYICELVKISAFTLQTLTLGATADTITGHYPQTFAETTIYGNLSPKGQSGISTAAGYYNRYEYVFVTASTVLEGDRIKDTDNTVYEVKQVTQYKSSRTDFAFYWKVCGCIKTDFAVQPATSGTWHVDSASVKTDPRNRQKVLIDTYLTAANIKKDNGTINASTLTCFDGLTYPITRLFLTKDLDAIAVISRKPSTPLYTDKLLGRKPYAFNEQIEIEIYSVNKSTVTATRLAESFEQEIRRIYTTYDPYANVRDLDTITPKITDLGYGYLYHIAILIEYKRSNDDYTAALPTITYGDTQGSTYTFPNATEIRVRDPDTGDIRLLPPGRIGNITQILGMDDFEVDIVADLDIDASGNKRWLRPQTSGAITDTVKWQVFTEIKFGGKTDTDQVYQNLNYCGTTIPVRLVDFEVDGSTLTVTFRRYSATTGSGSTSKVWYGIS
jgi:hypothetical protein